MGANEKHAWTPVTSFVMGAYEYDRSQVGNVSAAVARAEFDRWLNQVKADAKAEGLEEAASAAFNDKSIQGLRRMVIGTWLSNRAAQIREGS